MSLRMHAEGDDDKDNDRGGGGGFYWHNLIPRGGASPRLSARDGRFKEIALLGNNNQSPEFGGLGVVLVRCIQCHQVYNSTR